jgi:hypothetical protein
MRRGFKALGLTLLLLAGSASAQQRVPVPADVQFALFSKIWTLDRSFTNGRAVTVGIVYQRLYRESFVTKEEVLRVAGRVGGVRVALIEIDETRNDRDRFDGVDVAYLTPLRAVDLQHVLTETRARGIRSITGVPEYVGMGVAVGIGAEADRPAILIDLEAARREGSDFSSQLLKLARVIR